MLGVRPASVNVLYTSQEALEMIPSPQPGYNTVSLTTHGLPLPLDHVLRILSPLPLHIFLPLHTPPNPSPLMYTATGNNI